MNGSLADLQARARRKDYDAEPRKFRIRRVASFEYLGRKIRYRLVCGHVIESAVGIGRTARCWPCGQEGA